MADALTELPGLTAVEVAAGIVARRFSAVEYARELLSRLNATVDLGAFVAVDEAAVIAEAERADHAVAQGDELGALHGVLVAVKDNIDVAGLPAAAGTPALRGNRPTTDAAVVASLRAEGAIVLGKTNMHELAAGVTTDNAAFGRARNPYDRGRVPGGSSGGTAVAVGARLVPLGLGTDTGASNRVPAAHCGVIGFRPTVQRWPQRGLILNSPTRDTIGPMARSIRDIVLADAIVTRGGRSEPPVSLRGLRIGVPRQPFWEDLDSEVSRIAEDCLRRLATEGVTLVEKDLDQVQQFAEMAGVPIAMGEHGLALDAYLRQAGAGIAAADVFAAVASPDVRKFLAEHLSVDDADYRRAMTVDRPSLQFAYHAYLDDHELAAMILPTAPIPAPRIEEATELMHNGRMRSTLWLSIRNANASSIAGIPGLSLPAGITHAGLPVGIEIDGRFGDDRRILAIGSAIEQCLGQIAAPSLNL